MRPQAPGRDLNGNPNCVNERATPPFYNIGVRKLSQCLGLDKHIRGGGRQLW